MADRDYPGSIKPGNPKIKIDMTSLNAAVIGLGESGLSAARLLKRLGAEVRVSDNRDSEAVKRRAASLKDAGISLVETGKHTKDFIKGCTLVVVSPGVSAENELLKEAKLLKIPVISEIELGYLNCPAPIIAVTGTNGKTTTCHLINRMLEKIVSVPVLCGNIGRPFCDVVLSLKKDDVVVLEVSSFQLEYIEKFSPRVSMILNADTDHLDRHKNLKEYFQAKARIFENQKQDSFTILRKEDVESKFSLDEIKSKVILVSSKSKADVYIDEAGFVVRRRAKGRERVIHSSEVNLTAIKSMENFLFLTALTLAYEVDIKALLKVQKNFKGLEHRIEPVGVFNGISYINDSKATNVAATRQALMSLDCPVLLIAGGQDKDTDFSKVNFDFLEKVKTVILLGEARKKLKAALKDIKSVMTADSLEEALRLSKGLAARGDCVLLSPMCASFDMFEDYKDRGRLFKEIVKKINS
ncbi:MAG: UDP-N-acetylmuramoyl-L-alanine--D-glutamate ligase [Candidatus Omnitrophica bacterium]|nr:UDP-N-acetylmuramoyl-L-alanine--D-glutamate ligase [Candidatus Omnitrophota bacterium]